MDRLPRDTEELHAQMARHDSSDFTGLQALNEKLVAIQGEQASAEERWLELSELVG